MVWNMNFMTFHMLGRIIPTAFHIFQRGGSITNQHKMTKCWWMIFEVDDLLYDLPSVDMSGFIEKTHPCYPKRNFLHIHKLMIQHQPSLDMSGSGAPCLTHRTSQAVPRAHLLRPSDVWAGADRSERCRRLGGGAMGCGHGPLWIWHW